MFKKPKGYDEDFIEEKVWGWKYNVYSDHYMLIDICWVNKGGYCSWHRHQHLYNTFVLLSGRLRVTREKKPSICDVPTAITNSLDNPNLRDIYLNGEKRRTVVVPTYLHMFTALEDTVFIELASVKLQRDDIERLVLGGLKQL